MDKKGVFLLKTYKFKHRKYTLKKNWIFLKNNCPDENRKNYLQN